MIRSPELSDDLENLFPCLKTQTTLAESVRMEGQGLFTGVPVSIKIRPADPGTGIRFRRVDLPNVPEIPATVEHVVPVPRCTMISTAGAQVQTVEHLLSALRGLEIDNAIVELNAPEVPIFDGSARPFVEKLVEAGIRAQDAVKPVYALQKPVFIEQGENKVIALPSDRYQISYTLHYPHTPVIGTQFLSFVVERQAYIDQICACRTFCSVEELAPLIHKGLLRGGGLENGIVCQDNKVLNPEGLRHPHEMVGHKILDAIGDFSLMKIYFRAHIISIRSGHATNVAFAKEMLREILACSTPV